MPRERIRVTGPEAAVEKNGRVLLHIGKRYVKIPALVFAVLSVPMFAGGLTIDSYPEWMGERKTKEVMRLIEARHGGREVRLGASWPLEAGSNFYLLAEDAGLIEKRKSRTLFRDPETGTTLGETP